MNFDMDKVKKNIVWDFDLKNEFTNRKCGYGFVIDLQEGSPYLAIYHMSQYISKSEQTRKQPPQEILLEALKEQGINTNQDGLFPITKTLRSWIEENILI